MASQHLDQAEGLRRLMAISPPRVISIISALGSSTASLTHRMLSYLAASFSHDGANAHIIYGIDDDPDVLKHYGLLHRPSLTEVTQGKRPLAQAISSTRSHFTSSWLGSYSQLDPFLAPQLNKCIHSLAEAHEVVLVETKVRPQQALPLSSLNDGVIVIQMNERASSLKFAYSLIKQLHHQIGKREFGILVHGNTALNANHVFTKIASVARRFLGVVLQYVGYIPSHMHIAETQKSRRNLIGAMSNAGVANIYHEVAKRLLRQMHAFTAFDPHPMIQDAPC